MTAYWIAHITVADEDTYDDYLMLAGPAVKSHGGTFLARGGRHVTMEGTDHGRNVVAKFPSFDAAVGCYQSPEYQKALEYAKRLSTRHLSIVEAA